MMVLFLLVLPFLICSAYDTMGTRATSPAAITLGNGPTRGFTLKNYTTMPLDITVDTSNCTVFSKGPIKQNEGSGIEITRDRE